MQLTHTTPRLHLSPLTTDDTAFIQELVNTPGWLAFIGDRNVHNQQDAQAYIERILGMHHVTYCVVRKGEIPVGVITFIKRDYLTHHDIGFAFLPQYNKQGYAYEAAVAILRDAIKENEMVLATTVPANERSISLLQKMGLSFQYETQDHGEKLHVYGISADKFAIDQLIRSFYQVFTNKHRQPDFPVIYDLCTPQALIIRKEEQQETIYNLDTFIEPRRQILTDGTLTDFEEWEIKEDTHITQHIAHRTSQYCKKGIQNGESFEGFGTKLFQFIKTNTGWKIAALLWQDQ